MSQISLADPRGLNLRQPRMISVVFDLAAFISCRAIVRASNCTRPHECRKPLLVSPTPGSSGLEMVMLLPAEKIVLMIVGFDLYGSRHAYLADPDVVATVRALHGQQGCHPLSAVNRPCWTSVSQPSSSDRPQDVCHQRRDRVLGSGMGRGSGQGRGDEGRSAPLLEMQIYRVVNGHEGRISLQSPE